MLAYHFPPLGGVAVMRVLRFCKYLPQYGWRPIVISVQGGGNEPRDESLLDEVPADLEVHRVPCFEPDNFADTWDKPREKIIRNLFKTFDFLLFPDDRAFWARPAARKAVSISRQTPIDIIWATAQPFTTLKAGMMASLQTGIPLVTDFRDDWTTSNADFRQRSPSRQKKEAELEQKILRASQAVISVTPGIVEALKARRPHGMPEEHFYLLPNGFDPEHFPPQEGGASDDTFTILHAGGIYPKRDPTVFLEGLKLFLQRHPEARSHTRVKFAGRIDPATYPLFQQEELKTIIECPGFLPHRVIRKEMRSSSVLLLLLEQVKTASWLYSGKIFEYIGAGRPILSLNPKASPLTEIIEATGFSHVASPDDPEETARALTILYRQRNHIPPPNKELQNRFNAANQARILADILERCVR